MTFNILFECILGFEVYLPVSVSHISWYRTQYLHLAKTLLLIDYMYLFQVMQLCVLVTLTVGTTSLKRQKILRPHPKNVRTQGADPNSYIH